jgi:hypothetical protein
MTFNTGDWTEQLKADWVVRVLGGEQCEGCGEPLNPDRAIRILPRDGGLTAYRCGDDPDGCAERMRTK